MSNCIDHCSECQCVNCGNKWLAERAAKRIQEELADEWLLSFDEPEKISSINHCSGCRAPLKAGGPVCIGCLGWMPALSTVREKAPEVTSPPVGQDFFELYKAACAIPWEPRKLSPRRFHVEPPVIRRKLY